MKDLLNQLKELERKEKRYLDLSLKSTTIEERNKYKKLYRKTSDLADKIHNKIKNK